MHIHILGICGTFMGSLAQLAVQKGYRVTGSDMNVYPPMSTQLESAGIELIDGFDASQIDLQPDIFVIGNVVSRGNPLMEAILNRGLPYISGPQWLSENVLSDRWVLAVSGTHGKTTTSSMLAWILEYCGYEAGFLIGGVPGNFSVSARLGNSDFFVIEADEYDTAFFDKRSKFVHYRPRTLVINNLEFDHADIFDDLAAIQKQFHHLIRIVPEEGLVVYPKDEAVQAVIDQGCWSQTQTLSPDGDWSFNLDAEDGSLFSVLFESETVGSINWDLSGQHNVANAISAIACARHVGVPPEQACEALAQFKGVKRRLEKIGQVKKLSIYDDFAHHPTAIETTLEGMRSRYPKDKITAIIEPRSNTMKQGVHGDSLLDSAGLADSALWYDDRKLNWSMADKLAYKNFISHERSKLSESIVFESVNEIIDRIATYDLDVPHHIVIMSNGGFQNIHKKLLTKLEELRS